MTQVRFLGLGTDEFEDITIEVDHYAEYPRASWGSHRGTCAFCFGDPAAENRCAECGGGFISRFKSGDVPLPGLSVKMAPSGQWGEQHVPHADGCSNVTYIERWYASCPDYAMGETCPVCQGRPS